MKIRTAIAAVIFGAATLSAEGTDTTAAAATAAASPAAKHAVKMFTTAQADSVLALIPGIDSLRRGSGIIGVGLDTADKAVVVIAFDPSGVPAKFVFPDSALLKQPAAPAVATPKPAPAVPPGRLDQRGRTWFILETAFKTVYVYPLAYASALPHASDGLKGGLSLLTVGGSLYGTFAFTRNMELGYGRAGLMNFGSTFLGTHYPNLFGSFLRNATSIDSEEENDTNFSTPSLRVSAWMSITGLPLGIYLGSRLNIVDRNDAGRITLMGFFSQPTAYLLGYGLPFYFLNPGKNLTRRREYFGTSALLTMALMPAGFYAGHKIAGSGPVPTGRGSLPYVTGIMGGLTGLFLPTLFDLEYDKISTARLLVTTTTAGYAGGTALGLAFNPSKSYTYWQTVFIGASSGAGALMFIALPLIGEVEENHKPYVVSGIFGGWLGFFLGDYLSQSLFEKSDRDLRPQGLRVSLPGIASLPFILSNDRNSERRSLPPLPVAELEWRF
ncbi:MAG: hypothetical protein JW699_01495 [Chitinispirillaceae bacterium]|nr:hypothetical protein [Chitinispirillaceae bacterium]